MTVRSTPVLFSRGPPADLIIIINLFNTGHKAISSKRLQD